jgi:hypothetical protein
MSADRGHPLGHPRFYTADFLKNGLNPTSLMLYSSYQASHKHILYEFYSGNPLTEKEEIK